MAEKHLKPHAIMIAFPMQGHINPFVNLAIKLATNGFTITYVHTEFIHNSISKAQPDGSNYVDFFTQARESGLDIHYKTVSDGFPVEFDRDLNASEYWMSMLRDFPSIVDEFIGKIIESCPSSAPFLISDTFYTWPAIIAEKYNIVNVSFWTQPALIFLIDCHLDLLKENGHFPPKDKAEDFINYIPGIQSISTKDLMVYIQDANTITWVHEVTIGAFEQVKRADFILSNTAQELEPETHSILNQKQSFLAIGPLFPTDFTKTLVPKSLRPESDCSQWLSSKPAGSVLYVSFGSLAQTSKEVIKEIAHGLLLTQVPFIWVIREDMVNSNETNILPDEFKHKIQDQGLIVPWCNQNEILLNPGVGGFMTHCGWNSILESIWCGVPMICHPIYFEQTTNRKLLVDDWKVGINLCDDGVNVGREEVAKKISTLMKGKTSDDMKTEIQKLQKILHNAVNVDGSSVKNFDRFIKDLQMKIYTKIKEKCN